jgi:hypothetical protein
VSTVLDFGILTNFSFIFIFLAVFLAGWGLLLKIDFFKLGNEGRKLYSVMAFALSFIVILSPGVVELLAFMIPWLTIVLFIAFFMLFFAMVFNPDLDTAWLIGQGPVYGFLITFVVIILLFGLSGVFGQDLLEAQPGVGGVSDADLIRGEALPADEFVPVGDAPTSPLEGQVGASNAGGHAPQERDIGSEIILTLFHPSILGMFFVLLLATVTMLLIAR